jgi:hypothetical protein
MSHLIPDGYKVGQVVTFDFAGKGYPQYVVAITDSNADEPEKPVKLLYVDWDKRWHVQDTASIHSDADDPPTNFIDSMTIETIGQAKVLYVHSYWSAGGPGAGHFYGFYTVEKGKLSLLKEFVHSRMMRLYFCLMNHSIYDAVLVKKRGEKHGKSYVYTCYLDVTKYTCAGKAIIAVGSEKLREKQGNRFLDEKYWCMSVCTAIKQGEVFKGDVP